MSDIRIENYLHHYIGQQFRWFDGDKKWRDWGKLTPYQYKDIMCYNMTVQLALRPLTDMTESELKELIILMEGSIPNEKLHKRVKQHQVDTGKTFVQWFHYTGRGIKIEGEKIVCNLSSDKNGLSLYFPNHFYYRNSVQLIPWLLKQGFDIFGLIEAGLAIDKTTING